MPALRTRDTPSQSLEVITDTIQPPSLAIVSPTPRAISFPFNQTQTSPYSSPTSSPFEPDLRKLTLSPSKSTLVTPISPSDTSRTTSSSTSVFSTIPSTTSLSTFPASPSSPHKRRKSSTCSDLERRPKKGDEDYIKRPENAFILFRRQCCEDRQATIEEAPPADGPTKKQRQADLSKTISQQWKALSPEERLYWEELAKEKKKEHEQMYPNYVYRPQRCKDRKGKKGKRGEEGDSETSISFVLPLCTPALGKNHGRSSSAPTPPPPQTIQIPSVYMPSCPTSPSMVPMINRRASHPDHGSSLSSQFDFVASNTAMPQQQYSPSQVFPEANAFYHGIPEYPHRLSIPNDMSMGQVLQMDSPASSVSSGSGPSSPASSTFSPMHCVPTDFAYPLAPCDPLSSYPEAGSFCGGPLDVHFGFPACSWEAAGSWGNHTQILDDEFDMTAIPPVQLGLPGCGDEILVPAPSGTFNIGYTPGPYDPMVIEASQYSSDSQNQDVFEQLFNFENMLAAHHGY
ncbi:hypothetical protein JVT61DRAFT_14305 [Boletus reticuloceps]|uniref:HMG box domain-containing protein n=1 Tax=Boletus reticuloceps TaxID=495285 RepID=A0A8I2YCR9_9AGAM|nr:hypothetical protein JVT61DRAFT_14305 [Boletus reticuloceps]